VKKCSPYTNYNS